MTKAAVSLTIPPLLLCTKNKLEIRSRPLLEPGSDYLDSVPAAGLEPARGCPQQILSLPRLPFRHAGISASLSTTQPKIIIPYLKVSDKHFHMTFSKNFYI